MLEATNPAYLGALRDPIWDFSEVTPEVMLAHLFDNYGQMLEEDILANDVKLALPFNPTKEAMESLFNRGRDCQLAVAAINPMSELTKIIAICKALQDSGYYIQAVHDWDDKAANLRTYPLMTTHFLAAERTRIRKTTTAQAGFHAANRMAGAPGAQGAPETKPPALAAALDLTDAIPGFGYCWSHGLTNNPNHTSLQYNNPAHNHNHAATLLANMMGGNQTIRRRINETAVYQRPPHNPNNRQNNNNTNNNNNNNRPNNNNNRNNATSNNQAANQPTT